LIAAPQGSITAAEAPFVMDICSLSRSVPASMAGHAGVTSGIGLKHAGHRDDAE